MKRILFVIGEMNLGGAESFIMKMYRGLDTTRFQFDFVVNKDGYYSPEIKKRGGRIFYTTLKSQNFLKAFMQLKKIVKENHYEDVIRFGTSNAAVFDLLAAKQGGAIHLGVRTLSANQGGIIKSTISKLLRPMLNSVATIKFAPSKLAAEATYGKKAKGIYILNNGINFDSFAFDPGLRTKVRKDLNIDNESVVLGHVGRLSKEKNHVFLLNLFSEYQKINKNSYLVLVGDGPLMHALKQESINRSLADRIIFMGNTANVASLYSSFDYFLFPSLYEGMPNALIEAQANGLPCFYSDQITNECELSKNIFRLELDVKIWLRAIVETVPQRTGNYRFFEKKRYLISNTIDDFITKLTETKY